MQWSCGHGFDGFSGNPTSGIKSQPQWSQRTQKKKKLASEGELLLFVLFNSSIANVRGESGHDLVRRKLLIARGLREKLTAAVLDGRNVGGRMGKNIV